MTTEDSWPTADTVVTARDTLVGAPPPPPGAPPPPGDGPGDRRIGAGMLLALGTLALVAAGIAVAWLLTHRPEHKQVTTVVVTTQGAKTALPPKVDVPRLVGLKEQQALMRLGQVGLRPKEIYRATRQPSHVVVSQKPPEATELRRGGQVTMVIDAGAPKVAVPDLTGKSFGDAQAMLDKLGLDSTKTEVTSAQPSGTIVDQAPKPGGKLAKGSSVTLSVSTGPPQTATTPTTTAAVSTAAASTAAASTAPTPQQPAKAQMPDVAGQTEAAAVQALGGAGILASIVFVPSDQPLGTVVQQAKPAGTTLPYHSHVQINLSRGPNDNPPESVPSVVGQTLQQAVATLNAHHLRLIYLKFRVTSRAQVGKVVQQSPQDGQAPQNAQVVVYLGVLQS
jgi:beta-lactam-binding protein with PASTA domain